MHSHHLNCVLLDTGSGCASPLSIDGVAFGVGTWSTSRVSTVQVGQTVLDHYTSNIQHGLSDDPQQPSSFDPELIRFISDEQHRCMGLNSHGVLRYCRNVRLTWVKFNSKDSKESE